MRFGFPFFHGQIVVFWQWQRKQEAPFMAKDPQEWFRQADYDMETAEYMFQGDRYFYSVFMCHLCVEKALKGLYQERLKEIPPRVHNLVYLLNI